jgi:subtilisin-like proprotein convertase family protein
MCKIYSKVRQAVQSFSQPIQSNAFMVLSEEIIAPLTELVDWVSIEVDIVHTAASDLRISLISPLGTRSELAKPRTKLNEDKMVLIFLSLFILILYHFDILINLL